MTDWELFILGPTGQELAQPLRGAAAKWTGRPFEQVDAPDLAVLLCEEPITERAKPKDDTWARYEIAPPLEPPTVSLSRRNDEAVHRPSSPSNYARQLVSAEHPVE